ncbi:hypothetical protein PPYR_00694 [Photinus pyralis]|uniref:Cytochrome c oxidase subunit 7C, mitochondrial n=1 Tax=Photinus pyralis TaxID=7054 RepID=A0A5N4B2D0_PHOPY|nr:hypothetical protein PPYR_00694 [Photinus pyralis]
MLGRSSVLLRNAVKGLVRNHHGGVPGENLPFEVGNKYKLTAIFIVFFGSGLGLPFLALRHQLLKQQ